MKIIKRPNRCFLPEDFSFTTWKELEIFFQKLLDREIASLKELKQFLQDRSELESFLEENFAWRYIKMNCDTKSVEKKESFLFFVQEIQPNISPFSDKLNKKIVQNKFTSKLPDSYKIFLRKLETSIEIFREKNVPLFTEIEEESQKYGVISSQMMIEHEGEKLTIQQAGKFLESPDRQLRETIYRAMSDRRLEEKEKLDNLMDRLIYLRDQVAYNADFENFRDYKFKKLNRFDYTPKDCEIFHETVKQEILPLLKKFQQHRKEVLELDMLRPWDLSVDISGKAELKPFTNSKELVKKTIKGFSNLDPNFGEYIEIMRDMRHFDLDSRKGKAPGGFNYPLYEIGVPFIFMNAVGTHRDLETMVHEGGHAIHSFLTKDLEISDLKSTPSEVAELASQSMELISMDFWDLFYTNQADLKRAKQQKLETSLSILPWICVVDKFQHWLYVNPKYTSVERQKEWMAIVEEFSTQEVDYIGLEEALAYKWQSQLHIFEVPFYYIEYGFSQLGSIALWKNFLENRKKGLKHYKNFMRLGSTKSIPEIYQAAGISFKFSASYVRELAEFVLEQYER
ncbi:M3 family oligoendopeptidase [Candidatus Gracilibacteria bacterium]|nr:M3 family oligoendopeptidase [Candidatus Gracilibacteria bacterium]